MRVGPVPLSIADLPPNKAIHRNYFSASSYGTLLGLQSLQIFPEWRPIHGLPLSTSTCNAVQHLQDFCTLQVHYQIVRHCCASCMSVPLGYIGGG